MSCFLMDCRLLVGRLLWYGDGSSLVGAASYHPKVSGSPGVKQPSSQCWSAWLWQVRPPFAPTKAMHF
jgi:hypothetical protein